MIEVSIVDDHPLYRDGLAMVIQSEPDLHVMGEARSMEELEALDGSPDVVLLDLHLPGITGTSGVARACAAGHRVLVVSAAGSPDNVVSAIAAGAAGFLTKEADRQEVLRAVRTVAGGDTYVSPTLASFLVKANAAASGGTRWSLSKRELEVLALVASGETDSDIAEILSISKATVRSHLDRIRDKTGARRRAELASHAHRLGIVDGDR